MQAGSKHLQVNCKSSVTSERDRQKTIDIYDVVCGHPYMIVVEKSEKIKQ